MNTSEKSYLESNIDQIIGNKSKKSLIIKVAISIATLAYIYSLTFGESSLGVYFKTAWKQDEVTKEYNNLQKENQNLQKQYFELIQLTPDSSMF